MIYKLYFLLAGGATNQGANDAQGHADGRLSTTRRQAELLSRHHLQSGLHRRRHSLHARRDRASRSWSVTATAAANWLTDCECSIIYTYDDVHAQTMTSHDRTTKAYTYINTHTHTQTQTLTQRNSCKFEYLFVCILHSPRFHFLFILYFEFVCFFLCVSLSLFLCHPCRFYAIFVNSIQEKTHHSATLYCCVTIPYPNKNKNKNKNKNTD